MEDVSNEMGDFPTNHENQNAQSMPAISLSGNNAQRTLWIGDVPKDWSEERLAEVFTECSHPPYKVKRVFLKGELQPYCFIEFLSFEDARNTLYDLNGNRIPGSKGKNRFNLCFANDSYNPNSEFNLHVSNVPRDLLDAELYRVFDKYQSCRGAKMFRFLDGASKGSGYVRFGDQTDQQMALVEMHRTRVHNSRIILQLAGPRGEKLSKDGGPYKGPRNGNRETVKASHRSTDDSPKSKSFQTERDLYGPIDPYAILPDEDDLDPVIGLSLLPASYRPQISNKRIMIESEQLFFDLESSRWSSLVWKTNEKVESFAKKLGDTQWKIVDSQ